MEKRARKNQLLLQPRVTARKMRTLVIACSVAFSLCPLMARSSPNIGELAHFVVQINAAKTGSGVIIESSRGQTTVLTARHLIEGTHLEEKPTLTTVDGVSHRITAIKTSSFLDLAELEIKGDGYAVPKLLANFRGGLITIIGFPNRTGKLTAASGVAETPGTTPLVRMGGYSLRHNARTEDGYSGAGVFDANGELVGIHGQSDLIVSAKGTRYLSSSGQAIPIKFWIQAQTQGGLETVTSVAYPAPSTATDFSLMGSENLSADRASEALAFFEKASILEPEEIAHLGNQATALIALRRFEEALTKLNQALLKDSENPSIRLIRANALYEVGSDLEALNDLNWILGKFGYQPVALQNRAQVLMRLNRLNEAEQDLNQAIPQLANPIHALRVRAKLHLLKNQDGSAMEDFNKILEIDENEPGDWINRASLFMKLGNLEAARYDLKAALGIDIKDPDGNKAMGVLEAMSNNYKAAIPLLETATRLKPNDPEAHARLGEAYYKAGERAKACRERTQATMQGQRWDKNTWDTGYLESCR